MNNNLKITEAQVDKAFKKEKDINQQLEAKRPDWGDDFNSIYDTRDFLIENAEKVGDLWKHTYEVNCSTGNYDVTCHSIWQFYPNYNGRGFSWTDGKRYDRFGNVVEDLDKYIYENSETEKVLYQNKQFRISLWREKVLQPTDIYWGHRLSNPIYALFDSNDKLIYSDEKAWRFKKVILDNYREPLAKDIYAKLAIGNPFKIKAIPLSNKAEVDHIREKLKFSYWQFDEYYKELNAADYHLVFILGYGQDYIYKRSTWFLIKSKKTPTNREIFNELGRIVDTYNFSDTVSFLNNQKALGINLNKLNLNLEERFRYLVNEKFCHKIKDIFGLSKISDLRIILNE